MYSSPCRLDSMGPPLLSGSLFFAAFAIYTLLVGAGDQDPFFRQVAAWSIGAAIVLLGIVLLVGLMDVVTWWRERRHVS